MPTDPQRKAAAKKAAAARAEKTPDAKTFTWRDLTFDLPAQLPATVAFDFADMAESDSGPLAAFRLLGSIIGNDHLAEIRKKIAADGDTVDDLETIIGELFTAAFEPYGISLGESPASPSS